MIRAAGDTAAACALYTGPCLMCHRLRDLFGHSALWSKLARGPKFPARAAMVPARPTGKTALS
eukprot:760115-Alexandrium_andersonii.AAC.1